MVTKIALTGFLQRNFESLVEETLGAVTGRAAFVGCAYVSIYGAQYLRRLTQDAGITSISLISDIRDCVTHPAALRLAMTEGWSVRTVNRSQGTFHPKLIVLSERHSRSVPIGAQAILCGSNNLSRAGLHNNIEACVSDIPTSRHRDAERIAQELWRLGQNLTDHSLARYEARFRERNRHRPLADLNALGVSEDPVTEHSPSAPSYQSPSLSRSVTQAAWAGLESFTGDYTFQLEFPRDAALVLQRLATAAGTGANVNLLCSDGIVRPMHWAFYPQNDMFRLNIPNDVPGVPRARVQHRGVGLVEAIKDPRAKLRLTVSDDRKFVSNVHGRSFALGTWGRTPTRLYGWF